MIVPITRMSKQDYARRVSVPSAKTRQLPQPHQPAGEQELDEPTRAAHPVSRFAYDMPAGGAGTRKRCALVFVDGQGLVGLQYMTYLITSNGAERHAEHGFLRLPRAVRLTKAQEGYVRTRHSRDVMVLEHPEAREIMREAKKAVRELLARSARARALHSTFERMPVA